MSSMNIFFNIILRTWFTDVEPNITDTAVILYIAGVLYNNVN